MYKQLRTNLALTFILEAKAVTIDNNPIQLAQTSAELIDWSSLLAILNRGSTSGQSSSINSIWDLLNDNAPAPSEN